MFVYAGSLFGTPQSDEARGLLVARMPSGPGATFYPFDQSSPFGRSRIGIWVTRDERGVVSAIGGRDDRNRPLQFVPRTDSCFPNGFLAGFDNYNLDGTTAMGPARTLRYPIAVEGEIVRIDLTRGALTERGLTRMTAC